MGGVHLKSIMSKYPRKQSLVEKFKYKPEYQRAMSNKARLKVNKAIEQALKHYDIPDNDCMDLFLARNILS